MILPQKFYNRDTATVAKDVLGKLLCRCVDGHFLAGIISEVEAYYDQYDSASHASKGRTPRNSVMFGPPGFTYVYFIYGMHYMLNFVTEKEGQAGAVLIRALQPTDGIDIMIQSRHGNHKNISNGPAKICQALQIDTLLNKIDLTKGEHIWLCEGISVSEEMINTGPRIEIDYAHERDKTAHLRFWLPSRLF